MRSQRKNALLILVEKGPLRIDVTVTAKWPLCALRNVTPFTPSHFRQSSEQMFLVLVFVFLKTVFWNLFPMLCEQQIWKAKHFLDIFLTDSSQKVLVSWRRQQCENFALLSDVRFDRLHGFSTPATCWLLACNTIETHEPAGEFRVCELAPRSMARLLLSMSQRWFLPCCSSWLTLKLVPALRLTFLSDAMILSCLMQVQCLQWMRNNL